MSSRPAGGFCLTDTFRSTTAEASSAAWRRKLERGSLPKPSKSALTGVLSGAPVRPG